MVPLRHIIPCNRLIRKQMDKAKQTLSFILITFAGSTMWGLAQPSTHHNLYSNIYTSHAYRRPPRHIPAVIFSDAMLTVVPSNTFLAIPSPFVVLTIISTFLAISFVDTMLTMVLSLFPFPFFAVVPRSIFLTLVWCKRDQLVRFKCAGQRCMVCRASELTI